MMLLKFESLILGLLLTMSACTTISKESNTKNEVMSNVIKTESLYDIHCEACHGMDGTKGISGAANLKVSKMTDFQIKNTIKNGNDKGMMPFKDIINSETEIDSLVSFVKSLRN